MTTFTAKTILAKINERFPTDDNFDMSEAEAIIAAAGGVWEPLICCWEFPDGSLLEDGMEDVWGDEGDLADSRLPY